MNGDETLRDALRGDAKGGATSSDAWDRVRTRAGSIRQRRQLAQRAIGGLTAAALGAGVLVASGVFKTDTTVIATPTTGDQIVAVQGPNNGGDHLVVLSADDGHVIRTLADDIGITFGGISVTPDGKTVYFARRRTALPCDRIEIAKVPSAGGEVEVIGTGIHGVVSPDGTTLAYIRPPADNPCGSLSERVWRNLATGAETVFPVNEVRDQVASPNFPVAWSPDGTRLLLAMQACAGSPGDIECTNEAAGAVMVLPMRSTSDPDFGAMRFLDLGGPSGYADGASYLPDGRILAALMETEFDGTHNGAQLHRLVVFDENVQVNFRIQPVETLFESRQNGVLHIAANSAGDVLLHFGGDLLQRWRTGDAEATTIANDIGDVAWLPMQQSAPPEPTTTTTAPIEPVLGPNQMVVARADGQLDVIGPDGTVIRHLGSIDREVPWMAVSPDGTTAYYERDAINNRCDGAGSFDAVRIDFDPPSFNGINTGSWPALSPDGTKIAYRSGPCGSELVVAEFFTGTASEGGLSPTKVDRTVLAVDTLRTFSLADPGDGGPLPELVGPVGWDADNRHLMLRINREPSTEFWYVDTQNGSDLLSGPVFRARGEQGAEIGPAGFAPLGTTGRWAAIYINVGGPSLVEYDLTTDSIVGPLAEIPESGVTIVGSDTTGQNLLLLVPNGASSDLYRWSEGDAILTFVVAGITAADW